MVVVAMVVVAMVVVAMVVVAVVFEHITPAAREVGQFESLTLGH